VGFQFVFKLLRILGKMARRELDQVTDAPSPSMDPLRDGAVSLLDNEVNENPDDVHEEDLIHNAAAQGEPVLPQGDVAATSDLNQNVNAPNDTPAASSNRTSETTRESFFRRILLRTSTSGALAKQPSQPGLTSTVSFSMFCVISLAIVTAPHLTGSPSWADFFNFSPTTILLTHALQFAFLLVVFTNLIQGRMFEGVRSMDLLRAGEEEEDGENANGGENNAGNAANADGNANAEGEVAGADPNRSEAMSIFGGREVREVNICRGVAERNIFRRNRYLLLLIESETKSQPIRLLTKKKII
jgi:hypothetical protein